MKLKPEITKLRVACGVPGPEDGTSLMRGMGPLNAMAREDRRLELVLPRTGPDGDWVHSWDWLGSCDVVFLQRPFLRGHSRVATMARMMGLPLWVDWDDDLACLPNYNPKAHMYPADKVKAELDRLVRLADVVTVSTAELRRRRLMGSHNENKIRVIPNACHWPFTDEPRERRVTWRGGNNHDADLLDVLPQINKLSHLPQLSRWQWAFLGTMPWQVTENVPAANLAGDAGADVFLYMRMFAALKPWVHIVPLRDNPFNRCRSNLAWLEATCAGAVVLAPDWEEWQRPGVRRYRTAQEFAEQLKFLIDLYNGKEPGPCGPEVAQSREYIAEHLLLPTVNGKRWDLLNELWELGRKQQTTPHPQPLSPNEAERVAPSLAGKEATASEMFQDENLIPDCIELVRKEQKARISFLQRRLTLGYTRAARIMDELEKRGVVGPRKENGEHEILPSSKGDQVEGAGGAHGVTRPTTEAARA